MNKIDVLDHGYVRLVESMGTDLSIVRAARVSYDAAWRAGEDEGSDAKLLRYLWKNRHTTPFEAVEFQFEVMAPIFVLRQWHRHRTWTYNELSARYRELPEVYYVPKPDQVGQQSTSNKQMRVMTGETDMLIPSMIDHCCAAAFEAYRGLLQKGVPREIARGVLPLNTYSHMFAKVDLKNLFHFIDLRIHPHAQHEIQVYGLAMLELIKPVVPVSVQAFMDNR